MRERDPDAVKASEILSISLPIRKVDHGRLRKKYRGVKEGEVDEK